MNNIRKFLLEMGGYFCFMGNQYRIEIDGEEFFIDLLLYHRQLKCLVAIELKIVDLKPEYAGKMQFYLSAINDRVKLKDENPSIGIIICKDKNRTIVEYALKDVNKPIGVLTYKVKTSLIKKYPSVSSPNTKPIKIAYLHLIFVNITLVLPLVSVFSFYLLFFQRKVIAKCSLTTGSNFGVHYI